MRELIWASLPGDELFAAPAADPGGNFEEREPKQFYRVQHAARERARCAARPLAAGRGLTAAALPRPQLRVHMASPPTAPTFSAAGAAP